MGLKRPSRKILILAGSAVLLIAIVITGALVARNLMRGGADSPEQAASKMMESVSNKDLVGMFTMVTPRERDAVLRTKDALLKKYGDLKVADAAIVASGKSGAAGKASAASSELSFDGIDVTITGVQPQVTPISEDLAAVNLNSGEFRVSMDPAKTKGMVRAQLDALGATTNYKQSFFLADLGKNRSGLTLIAKKTDGRWYISPLLSGLDIANNYFNGKRGAIRAVAAKGSDSAQAAASAAVSALPAFLHDGPKALAPYLESDEATAIDLYGDTLFPWLNSLSSSGSSLAVGSATFTAGPQAGDLAVAFVDRISFSPDGNSKTTLTATCLSQEGSPTKECLNGSGYNIGFSHNSFASLVGSPLIWGADRGKFALTTVKEDGGWKVSLLDTAADHAVSWMNSLTREQALTYLGLESGDKTAGTLTVGKRSMVAFNSAGYAVLKLQVPQTAQLELIEASEARILSPDGKSITYLYPGDGNGARGDVVKAGNYTVVLRAGGKWEDAFAKAGNKVVYSAPVLIQKYVQKSEPPSAESTPATGAPTQTAVDQAKVAALLETISANPNDIATLAALGDLYFAATDYNNAAKWEQKVLAIDPKNQKGLLALGAAQFNLGNSAEAKKTWLVAVGLYPESAEVHYDLGFLYMSQTPPDNANMNIEWKKVIAIDPNSALAKSVATHITN